MVGVGEEGVAGELQVPLKRGEDGQRHLLRARRPLHEVPHLPKGRGSLLSLESDGEGRDVDGFGQIFLERREKK